MEIEFVHRQVLNYNESNYKDFIGAFSFIWGFTSRTQKYNREWN